MKYELNPITSDCYDGTSCLINKLNIKDEKILDQIEADITFAKTAELESIPIDGSFDTDHYKAIHKYLFEDLYDWAGEFRTVNLSKKGTTFADYNEIKTLCDKTFDRIKLLNYYQGLSFSDFINEIVDLYCGLNMIHPFREGNGRTQRIFIAQIIRYNKYRINFSKIDKDLLMIATIQSAQGVTDNLRKIFEQNIKNS